MASGTKPTRCAAILVGKELDTILLRQHVLSDSFRFFFSILGKSSGFAAKITGSRIRKEKVADSKISWCVWTRLQVLENFENQTSALYLLSFATVRTLTRRYMQSPVNWRFCFWADSKKRKLCENFCRVSSSKRHRFYKKARRLEALTRMFFLSLCAKSVVR